MGEARQRVRVNVEEVVFFRKQGYLVRKQLFAKEALEEMRAWADDIFEGRIDANHLAHRNEFGASTERKLERLASARLHMVHREHAAAERGMLQDGVLDVLEALIGPDVLALQSMMFFNPPGKGGQGWHQDSFYIPTLPESLIGVWIALDRADEANGCLWVAEGSHHEPIYPPVGRNGYVHADERQIEGLFPAADASHMDDEVNRLSTVAAKYGPAVPVVLEPGDVLFFHSRLLHRSYRNETTDRMRRSYVCHYCNARSWVPWNHGYPYEGDAANAHHILARGGTHLPYARPKFGTPVEVSPASVGTGGGGAMMVAMPGGEMGKLEM